MKSLKIITTILLIIGLVMLIVGIFINNKIIIEISIYNSLIIYIFSGFIRFSDEMKEITNNKGE